MPATAMAELQRMLALHRALPPPPQLGRAITIKRRPPTPR
jgi:hypothetical protein